MNLTDALCVIRRAHRYRAKRGDSPVRCYYRTKALVLDALVEGDGERGRVWELEQCEVLDDATGNIEYVMAVVPGALFEERWPGYNFAKGEITRTLH